MYKNFVFYDTCSMALLEIGKHYGWKMASEITWDFMVKATNGELEQDEKTMFTWIMNNFKERIKEEK